MKPITIQLPYPKVTGNMSVRHSRGGGHYKDPKYTAYESQVRAAVSAQKAAIGISEPVEVSYVLHAPDNRARDQGNVLKVVDDCLTRSGVWVDDSNKIIRRAVIEWGENVEGGVVIVTISDYQTMPKEHEEEQIEREFFDNHEYYKQQIIDLLTYAEENNSYIGGDVVMACDLPWETIDSIAFRMILDGEIEVYKNPNNENLQRRKNCIRVARK